MGLDLPYKEKEINGVLFRVGMLPMGKWFEFESLVMRMVGPALAELLAKSQGKAASIGDINVGGEGIGAAVFELTNKANPADHEKLVSMLSSHARADGQPIIDKVFWPSNMRSLMPFIVFGIETQLADFFAGAVSVVGGRVPAAQ